MAGSVIVRGSKVYFSFQFFDENGDLADVDSAELQLTYPGRDKFETEALTLELAAGYWIAEWLTTPMRDGWLQYHAHAYSSGAELAQDGRVRIKGNRASFDHDILPRAPAGDYSDAL